jgi:hypothetical protein
LWPNSIGARCCGLGERVIDQARGRVLEGERFPNAEQIYSLFDPHTALSTSFRSPSSAISEGRSLPCAVCVCVRADRARSTDLLGDADEFAILAGLLLMPHCGHPLERQHASSRCAQVTAKPRNTPPNRVFEPADQARDDTDDIPLPSDYAMRDDESQSEQPWCRSVAFSIFQLKGNCRLHQHLIASLTDLTVCAVSRTKAS